MDAETLASAVGSLMLTMQSCGDLLAPTLAGCLYDALGFQWTMTVGGSLCFFTGTLLSIVFIIFGSGNKKSETSTGENVALLSSEKSTTDNGTLE